MSTNCPPDNSSHPSDCQILEQFRLRSQQRHKQDDSPEYKLLMAKAEPIRLLLLDVDGVLSDGTLIYSENGVESKSFNTKDGLGIKLVQQCNIDVGVITARSSQIVQKRAEELGLKYIMQGVGTKREAFKTVLKESDLKPIQVCYMGDDWIDLALLTSTGLATCPADAVAEVRDACHYVATLPGGKGAVREICDILVLAKGMRDTLLQNYIK